MRARHLWLFSLLVAALSGCSLLLDYDVDGLPCDNLDGCLEGYYCGPDRTCIPIGSDGSCDAIACGAGRWCTDGACRDASTSGQLGSPCTEDAQCSGEGAFCLLPYGGGIGACTRDCTGASCGGYAPDCRSFPSAGSTLRLCVADAFRGCTIEEDCTNGLTCGVYGSTYEQVGITACRTPVEGGVEIGRLCDASEPCANGLCVEVAGASRCSTTCTTEGDCAGAACEPVSLESHQSVAVDGSPSLCGAPAVEGD